MPNARDFIECKCPHCEKIITPMWCPMGLYYECPECSMAFREEDYEIEWF